MDAPLVSVVVDNYNYAPYLRQAIDSALQQSYPRIEVVVVDDGSTDASADVIADYSGRVRAVLKPNGGQGSSFNAGFAASQGELVLFLDADDYYRPDAVEQVVAAARSGAVIVHWRLQLVDSDGEPLGEYPPRGVRLAVGDVVGTLTRTGDFTRMMTSGNAFRRDALACVMPIPETAYRLAAEGYLLHTLPFLGPVAAIERPLGCYRVHTSNNGGLEAQGHVKPAHLRRRMEFWRREAHVVRTWARARGMATPARLDLRNHTHLMLRLASLRLDPALHPYPKDRGLRLGLHGIRAVLGDAALPLGRRAVLAAWFAMVALAPRPPARRLVDMLLVPGGAGRPAWLRARSPGHLEAVHSDPLH